MFPYRFLRSFFLTVDVAFTIISHILAAIGDRIYSMLGIGEGKHWMWESTHVFT